MYPDRNPFPPQATMSLDAMSEYRLGDIPTAKSRVPLQRLRSIQHRYLDDPAPTGRAVALHGPHGTGKTHTVLAALSEAQAAGPSAKPPVVLYVRADGPDPLPLYRKLMSRWTAAELGELTEQAFAGYAADEFIASRDPVTGETDDTRRLRADPRLVKQAMREDELSYTAVVNRLDDDIRRIQGRFGNFERVLRGLSSPALRPAAHRWLLAETVSADELNRLGVAGVIEQLSEIRIGIHVLAALARRAGRPLTLAMDQVEAFVRRSDGTIDAANAGLLREVVEDIVEEQGLLIVAVAEHAWQQLPPDLRQRFGPSEIRMPELSLGEAGDVLSAYLAPWPPDPGQPATFPFLPDAVRQLLVESGGNLRRYLQASYVVFNNWDPGPTGIGADMVTDALGTTGGEWSPNEKDIRRTVRQALQKTEWDVKADHRVDGQHIDFAVLRGERIVLAVEIIQAVFGQDEAIMAVSQIETIQTLQGHRPVIVLVVVGYSSPDVRNMLQEAGRVVVANGTDFASELEAALREAAPEIDTPVPAVLHDRLTQLREELVTLIERRSAEERLVSAKLEQSHTERSTAEWNEQLQRFRLLWVQERQKIEKDIDLRRSQRRHDDVAEIATMHDEYVQQRTRRARDMIFLGAGTLLLFLIIVVTIFVLQGSYSSAFSQNIILLLLITVIVGIGASSFSLFLSRQRPHAVSVSSRTQSIDDLNRITRQDSVPILESADPFRRYRAILGRDHLDLAAPRLYSMALREPSAIMRRALLTTAIAREPDILMESLHSGLEPADLSAGVEATASIGEYWDDLPVKLRVVAILRHRLPRHNELRHEKLKPKNWLEWFIADWADGAPYEPTLARAFETDDDGLLAEALQDVSERDLRRAAAVLSPLDRDGLGSHYWLDSSDTITDMYLFFRKALFFLAGGIERPPA